MKFFTPCAVVLAVFSAAVAFGSEAEERRMGDDALLRADYPNAVRYYTNALRQAGNDQALRGTDMLRLGRAELRNGNFARAKELLEEFRRGNPGESAGMLPGELMVAEKRFADAARYFGELAAGASDQEERMKALFAAAEAQVKAGDARAGEATFARLERESGNQPEWAGKAHLGRIQALIEAGDFDRADALLSGGIHRKANPTEYAQLEMLEALRRGDLKRFTTLWDAQQQRGSKMICFYLATEAATLARRETTTQKEAVYFLKEAVKFSPNATDRRNTLRELINVEATVVPLEAVDTIAQYLKLFPEAPDRFDLSLQAARLAAAAGDYRKALALYNQILDDRRIPGKIRLIAAKEAAAEAAAAGDEENAVGKHRYLLEHAENNAQSEEANYLFGEYYQLRKKPAEAEPYFRAAAAINGIRAAESRYWLLQTLLDQNKLSEARPVAQALSEASQGTHRAASAYFLALIEERSGHLAEARKRFLVFLNDFPGSEYVPAALYHAAELALANRDFKAAAEEFWQYSERFPDHVSTPDALFLALQAACLDNDRKRVDQVLKRLETNYKNSKSALEARLQFADYLRQTGNFEEALRHLEETRLAAGKDPDVAAEVLYDRALIAIARQRGNEALRLLMGTLEAYPNSSVSADAAFLSGNLLSNRGNYAEALKFYRRAAELNSTGLFAQLCQGRIADCLYSLYSTELDRTRLEESIALFRKLTDSSDPRLRLQSYYKLAKCLELSDQNDEAVAACERVLYLAAEYKRQHLVPDGVWAGKALTLGVQLLLRSNLPDAAERALRMVRLGETLELPFASGEFDRMRDEITRKFNLQEKM